MLRLKSIVYYYIINNDNYYAKVRIINRTDSNTNGLYLLVFINLIHCCCYSRVTNEIFNDILAYFLDLCSEAQVSGIERKLYSVELLTD